MKWKLLCISLLSVLIAFSLYAEAAEIDELRGKISDHNQKIQELEKEITQYQEQLEEVGREKQNLQNAIRTLDISRNKLTTDIYLTENKIYSTDLQIQKLSIEIAKTEEGIHKNTSTIAALIRQMDSIESASLVEIILVHPSLADFSDQIEVLRRLQLSIRDEIIELKDAKATLERQKAQSAKKRGELGFLRTELVGQRKAVDVNREEKNTLLAVTKNEEANYQQLIEEKKRLRQVFEQELFEFESQLRIAIDPSSIPSAGVGVLRWPVDKVFITQYFGNTDFATQNPQIYSGRGHNGIDLRASPGTPVKSALSGTVIGTGDTDTVCPNASYGKWILIEHNNGLSTLYAHLSAISVRKGEQVATGGIIGYSGNTGYSTGPHLHFTVFASQGVEIRELKSRVCRGAYILPVADLRAYLNPLSYL
jgi:murein DD-endopeptidase MepM/ murein hydrolase activator NlpD